MKAPPASFYRPANSVLSSMVHALDLSILFYSILFYVQPNNDYFKRKNNLKHFIDNRYQNMISMNDHLINMLTRNTSNLSQIMINKLFEINENIK